MSPIQQVIKALRCLKHANGGDLAKSLKHAAAASAPTTPTPTPAAAATATAKTKTTAAAAETTNSGAATALTTTVPAAAAAAATITPTSSSITTETMSPSIVTSVKSALDITSPEQQQLQQQQQEHRKQMKFAASSSHHQQQQQLQQQQLQPTTVRAVVRQASSSTPTVSLISLLNEGGLLEAQASTHGDTQDSSTSTSPSTSTSTSTSRATSVEFCQKSVSQTEVEVEAEGGAAATVKNSTPHSASHTSQQIQNFQRKQQQQVHQHFHTQPQQQLSQHLNIKQHQEQLHLAMSSLAVEPLAHRQQDDVLAAATNGNSNSDSGGSNCRLPDARNETSGEKKSPPSAEKPCFNAGFAEILKFMELIGNLKHTKRTGWVLRDVNDCESISGHMYRMSMMTFLLDGSEGLNQIRCMELALVHDLAESLVGDITPFCGISKETKRDMEFKAMEDICKLIEPRGKRIMELFTEYEHGKSAESKFVKDLDRLDMVMQAFEYEKRDNCLLKHQEFFDSTEGKFNHPFVKKLVSEIYEQRKSLAKDKGATPPPSVQVPNMENEPPAATNGHHCDMSSVPQQTQQIQSSESSSS